MLARASSDAGTRLRRSKSTSTVHRHAPPVVEPLDPDIAHQHAIAAATAAFIRSQPQELTRHKSIRSIELSRRKSTSSRKSLTSQGSHFPPRDLSIRSVPTHLSTQTTSALRTSTSSAPHAENISLSHATPGSGRPTSSTRPLSAQPSLNEYARPTSQPKSHRQSTASSIASQQIRKARSMYYASSVQTGSPIARPPSKYLTTPPPTSASSTLSAAPTAYVPSRGIGPSPLAVPQIPVLVAAGETIDTARDKHLQDFQQRSIKHKPSLFLAPFRKRQDRSRDKTKRLSSILTSVPSSDHHFTDSTAGEITAIDFMPPQDKKDRRSLSGSLKKKIRRVFRRTSNKSSSLPVQQIEASRDYFNNTTTLTIDGQSDIPSPSDELLQTARSRTPSSDEACLRPTRSSSRSSRGSARSNRSLHSEANVSHASASRVTSWGTSASGETLTQRAIKRLTVIHEAKDSIGSVSDGPISTSMNSKSLPLPAFTAFRDPMHMESLAEEASTPPVDPKRMFSALMREIDASNPTGSSDDLLNRTPGAESDVFESSKTKESHSTTQEIRSSGSKDCNESRLLPYRSESTTARSIQSKKSSIRSFGQAIRSTIRTVTPSEQHSPPHKDESVTGQTTAYSSSSSSASLRSQKHREGRATMFRNFRLSKKKSALVPQYISTESFTPTAEQIETRVAKAKKRWQTPLTESVTPQFPRETDRLYTVVDMTQQRIPDHVDAVCEPSTSSQSAALKLSKPTPTPMSPSVYSRNTDGLSILPNESEISISSPHRNELFQQGGSAVILTSQSVRSYVIGTPSPNRPSSTRSSRDWKAWLSHEVSGIETISQEDITIHAQYTTPSQHRRDLTEAARISLAGSDDTAVIVRESFETSTPRAGSAASNVVTPAQQTDHLTPPQNVLTPWTDALKDTQLPSGTPETSNTSQTQISNEPKREQQPSVPPVFTPCVARDSPTSIQNSSTTVSQPQLGTPNSARMNDRFPFLDTGRRSSSNNSSRSQKSKSPASSMRSSLKSPKGTPGHQVVYSDISAPGTSKVTGIPTTVLNNLELSQKTKENITPPSLGDQKRPKISPLGLVSRPTSLQPLSSSTLHRNLTNIADLPATTTDKSLLSRASVPAETTTARPNLRVTIRPLSPEKLSRRPRSAFDLRNTPSPRPASEARRPTLQYKPSSRASAQNPVPDPDSAVPTSATHETHSRDGSVTPGQRMAERFLKERKSATVLERGVVRIPQDPGTGAVETSSKLSNCGPAVSQILSSLDIVVSRKGLANAPLRASRRRAIYTGDNSRPVKMNEFNKPPPQYCYDALTAPYSEIRILSLLPSRDSNAPLRGRLTVEWTPIRYEALSYVWGNSMNKQCLHIGNEGILISEGLSQALRRLRYPTKCRDLWIDAICINQVNNEEKNHQVDQMYKIYSRAARVLIWLGEGNQGTNKAMDIISKKWLPRDDHIVEKLFQMPWWRRIWTLQEGLAATSDAVMMCGNKEVPWWLVHSAIIRLIIVHKNNIPGLAAFSDINTHRRYGRTTFEDLVYAAITREGTDTRDHVYALLGLVQVNKGFSFGPDYERSAAWAYAMATVCITEQRQDLEFLVLRVRQGIDLAPTWCFDFSNKEVLKNAMYAGYRAAKTRSYFASSGFAYLSKFAFDASKVSITVAGVVVGTVVNVQYPQMVKDSDMHGPAKDERLRQRDVLFNAVRSFTALCRTAWSRRRTKSFTYSTICRGEVWRIVAGACHTNDAELWNAVSDDATMFEALMTLTEGTGTLSEFDEQLRCAVETCADNLAEASVGKKCFFATDTNYTGCSSKDTRENDILSREDYTVGWICALPVELAAAQEMLDEEHDDYDRDSDTYDENLYSLGSIAGHNVVIVCLPAGRIGNNPAAVVATQMKSTFKGIRFGLMVGIGGGVPSAAADIRLGDVVISQPEKTFSGMVQYDSGKATMSGFERTWSLNGPPQILLSAVAEVQASEFRGKSKVLDHMRKLERTPKFQRSKAGPDVLFDTAYDHEGGQTCDGCKTTYHEARQPRDEDFMSHYGTIASGNQVMKNAVERDQVSAQLGGVLCFDMEAAGLMNSFPCLVVRGICDYADSHKNKRWQPYAAAVAAAYAKEVLSKITPAKVLKVEKFSQILANVNEEVRIVRQDVEILQKDTHVRKVLEWLSAPDPSKNFDEARKLHHRGTGQWLLESREYTAWKTESNSFLWLYGIPGCGKTILSSSVIADLQQSTSRNVLHFYFDFNDVDKQSPEKAIRRLILQLYLKQEGVLEFDHLYASCANGQRTPRFEELCGAFEKMLRSAGGCCIVLDALDECRSKNNAIEEELFAWIGNLRDAELDIHLLVTSRPEHVIKEAVKKWGCMENAIPLQSSRVEHDINAYVEEKVKQISRWKGKLDVQKEIEETLKEKADGMFRWVSCQFVTLQDCLDLSSVREELANLPMTLDETYARILETIKPQHIRYSERLLQFLVYADRPMKLEEAVDAIAVQTTKKPRFCPENRMPDPEEITRYCPGLVVLVTREEKNDPASKTQLTTTTVTEIQLAHFSAKEYFLSKRLSIVHNNLDDKLKERAASEAITDTCLYYLLDLDHSQSKPDIIKLYPLAEFSARYWIKFAAKAEKYHGKPLHSVTEYVASQPAYDLGFSLHPPDDRPKSRGYTADDQPLSYAAFGGLLYTTIMLLEHGANPNFNSEPFGNPLQAASEGGHEQIVSVLLLSGADVNAEGGTYHSALQAASYRGHKSIFSTLLEHGANLNVQGGLYNTALHAASAGGHRSIVRLLLQKGADPSIRNHFNETALLVASAGGYIGIPSGGPSIYCGWGSQARGDIYKGNLQEPRGSTWFLDSDFFPFTFPYNTKTQKASEEAFEGVVEELIDCNADTDVNSAAFGTPLQAACVRQLEGIVRMLLCRGADTNIQGGKYGTALQAACVKGSKNIVQLLLDKGANVNVQAGDYGTALRGAADKGHKEILNLLIKHHVNVNEQCGDDGTALHAAVANKHAEIAQLLIDAGADVIMHSACYGTPLQAASAGGSERIVRALLQRHPKFVGQTKDYRSPLHIAAARGYTEIVKLLLATDADVHAQVQRYGTPLHLAAEGGDGYEEVVRELLDKGADPNALGGDYGTALIAASRQGNQQTVKLLLDNSANPNVPHETYGCALQIASYQGHLEVAQLLSQNGADLDLQGVSHSTALQTACITGNEKMICTLLNYGANINAKEGMYGSVLHAAAIKPGNPFNVEKHWIEIGFMFSLRGGHEGVNPRKDYGSVTTLLINRGADINAQGGRYGNALQATCYDHGDERIVRLLLGKGANVNAQGGDFGNALQAAAASGREAVVTLLIERGANVNAEGGKYTNALQAALRGEHKGTADLLRRAGTSEPV
ncbi:hypothetical protein OPT61_g5001 [Boeremia exigua]|uniref:Uncharacterized protein n=1 Tax=Boeremia exigua TaxID=749465 RepID=A0ACC2IC44_9PLEO|nr:hypothetical protein OPT61_g5001 [Boeremia exigua]